MKRLMTAVLCLVLLCGCAVREQKTQQTVFCMDTVMELQVWGDAGEEAVSKLEELLRRLENTWSATSQDSLLRGDRAPNDEEQAVLDRALALHQRTGGAFDPQLHTLMEVWGFRGEGGHVPTDEQIRTALRQREWDLGGALKGYAGEQAAALLEGLKVERALLNLGGNMQTYGQKPDGSPWQIGIQNPNGGDYLGVLSVEGTMAVVTSGDYQRYFAENGVRYHHILDPRTGWPADSGLSSVTVICRNGMTADGLSTALFVMGLEDGATFWRQSDDFEAVFVLKDGTIYATEGAKLSGCEFEVISG